MSLQDDILRRVSITKVESVDNKLTKIRLQNFDKKIIDKTLFNHVSKKYGIEDKEKEYLKMSVKTNYF